MPRNEVGVDYFIAKKMSRKKRNMYTVYKYPGVNTFIKAAGLVLKNKKGLHKIAQPLFI